MEPITRHSLLLRLRNRDDQAGWTEFVDIYEPFIYRLARAEGLQDADAHDLCQLVFKAVAGAIERWDPDPAKGKFRAWLFRIARNLLVNFLISQRRMPLGSGSTSVRELLAAQPARDLDAETEFAAEFQRQAFRWAADRVKTEFAAATWQAFWMTGVENRSIAEVAAELKLSVGAVYIARSRVLARLRVCVQQLTDDGSMDAGGPEDGNAFANM